MNIDNIKETNNCSSLTQTAYKMIKDKIIYGELKQGEIISIADMAKKLNVSRTPITYACKKLENDKFLSIIPKQGVIINTITFNNAREIYELRAAIESFSAKRAFSNITKNDICYLEDSYIRQVEAVKKNDGYLFMTEDIKFHKYLLTKYENSYFASAIDNLSERAFLLGIESCKNTLRLKENLKEHRKIIDCIINNNKSGFSEAVENNILNGYINLTGSYVY